MKKIWIWNHYATTHFFEKGFRHYYFAKYLKEAGYHVRVFCANTFHYGRNEYQTIDTRDKLYKEDDNGVPYVFIKTSEYKGNGLDRAKNMLLFARNVRRAARALAAKDKPDVIIASSVHPFTCVAGILTAKKLKIPCMVEIRDLWPESIVSYSMYRKKHPIIRAMYRLEKWIYKKADRIIFTMEGGADYLRDKGWDKAIGLEKIAYINNGVDLSIFDDQAKNNKLEDTDLDDPDTFKIAYTGSIRTANGLDTILDTAKLLKESHAHIRFLIWGDGTEKERLEKRLVDENITNVIFKGRIEKRYVAYVNVNVNVNVNVIENDIAILFRYGGSQNKIFDYLAAGKPIVSTFKINYGLIEKYSAGIIARSNAPEDVAAAIISAASLSPEEAEKMSQNARRAAAEHDYKVLTNKLIGVLKSL